MSGESEPDGFMFRKQDLGLQSQQRDELKTNLCLKEDVLLFSQTLDIKSASEDFRDSGFQPVEGSRAFIIVIIH